VLHYLLRTTLPPKSTAMRLRLTRENEASAESLANAASWSFDAARKARVAAAWSTLHKVKLLRQRARAMCARVIRTVA
jgi:hypothetical protein